MFIRAFTTLLNVKQTLESLKSLLQFSKMTAKTNNSISVLFARLNEASDKAELLRKEISNIQQEILIIKETDVFRDYLNGPNSSRDELDLYHNGNNSNKSKRISIEDNSSMASKKLKLDFNTEDDYVVVYTDGACENNGQKNAKAGIGVWFGDQHIMNISEPVNGKATNNTAEIQACVEAIRTANENGISKLKIKTDSQFTINCMTKWMKNWKKNNWRLSGGGEVKNKQDLIKLDEQCRQIDVKWEHVNGHQGIEGNEGADKLARDGAKRYRA